MVVGAQSIIAILCIIILFWLTEETNGIKNSIKNNYVKYLIIIILGVLNAIIKWDILAKHPLIIASIIVNIITLATLKISYKISWIRVIMTEILFLLANMMVEVVVTLLFMIVLKGNIIKFGDNIVILASSMALILMIIILIIFKRLIVTVYSKIVNIIEENIKGIMHYSLLIGIPILSLVILGFNYLDLVRQGYIIKYNLISVSIAIVGYAVYTILATQSFIKSEIKVHEAQQQNIYTEAYGFVIKDVKEFWHGYSNIMQGVYACIQQGNESTLNYTVLKELIEKYSAVDMDTKVSLISIEHPVVAGVLSTKLNYAKSLGVGINIKNLGTGNININMIDLIDTLGILLDNAIEAAYYATTKYVDIDLKNKNGDFEISIFNLLTQENGKVLKYGESNGMGLTQVQNVLTKHKNVKYEVVNTDKYYMVTLKIEGNKKG